MKKLVAVGTFVAGVSVGFVACGVLTVRGVLKSEKHRRGLVRVITEKVMDWLYTETESSDHSSTRPKVSYKPYIKRSEVEDILFDTYEAAECVLINITKIIEEYGECTVADFYELCDVHCESSDHKIGWLTADGMSVRKSNYCYLLELPKPVPIK